jgi:hypothetical protein
VQELYDRAFARLDRVSIKRREFARCWANYIAIHPWDVDVRNVDADTLEILAVMREPAPVELALIFSEWLAALRASLDNAIYALAAATTGQNPPPQAERIQYPICSTPTEFKSQAKRLTMLPQDVLAALEKSQPYQSPWGPESNLTWWIHELARTDRHRSLHIGIGRIDQHRIRVEPPAGVTIRFDESVEPYSHIDREIVVGRFTSSRPLQPHDIRADLTGVGIAPEIHAWASFTLAGKRQSLQERMIYTEIFTRNNLENMALMGSHKSITASRVNNPSA